jgi:4-oxalocrotonate tautomerase
MPFVHVRIADDNATPALKAALIAGITKVMSEVLNKNPSATHVVIEEVPTDNWGVGGDSLTVMRQRT